MTRRGRFTLVALAGLIVGSGVLAALPEPTETPSAPPIVAASAGIPFASRPFQAAADTDRGEPERGVPAAKSSPAREASPVADPPLPERAAPEGAASAGAPVTEAQFAAGAEASEWRTEWLRPPVSRAAIDALAVEDGRYLGEITDGSRTLHVRYTLDPQLTDSVWRVLRKGRVALGHVVVMDARSGALHAYASTDPETFPPQGVYPAASLVKVVTAAAALGAEPAVANQTCRYVGNPYRLRRSHLKAPRSGNSVSLRRALATSNNQCFARLAVDRLGSEGMLAAIDRFGLLRSPAMGHARGMAEVPDDDPLALGKLGSGLAGLRITPLHAVQLAAVLAHGKRVEPYWIERVASGARVLPPIDRARAEGVLSGAMADQLRDMLVETTRRGTARKAFRTRRGRPLLQGVEVAGKTGSLNGTDPKGRYEWFMGVAPADNPRIAVATLAVQGELYWMSASQLAAEVLKAALCPKGVCREDALDRLDARPIQTAARQTTPRSR